MIEPSKMFWSINNLDSRIHIVSEWNETVHFNLMLGGAHFLVSVNISFIYLVTGFKF